MTPCIIVSVKGKKIQFRHQFLYTGNGDERHCHFCQLTFPDLRALEKAREQERTENSLGEGI